MKNREAGAAPAPVNRFRQARPRVGIRPAIDGRRRGVRESLEEQTMSMARAAAELISGTLRHPDGAPVECVIAESCIAGATEAAACADFFARNHVGLSLTVSPCWCYGSETMDLDPLIPKAVWGFNGTERPGAVYLAAVLAAHNQKGLPAFGIYGRDVQDATDRTVPADVREKILAFVRAGLAVATMRGKSYLSMGGAAMGIAGSFVNPDFFESYLGMRCESIDMSEFVRRIEEGIFDPEEFARARAWFDRGCRIGRDCYASGVDDAENARVRDFVVKMTLIGRDLLIGNPKLAELGFDEEALGHNAIAGGFQGQRQWTDHFPNGDFMEAVLNSSFDWNGRREPFVFATENDSLNGAAMLFGHLLTGTAQGFSDIRTYWSPDAVARVAGHRLTGDAAGGIIHLINSGATALDASGRQRRDGRPAMKPYWEISDDEAAACLAATEWVPGNRGYFRGGGFSSHFLSCGGMPVTLSRINLVRGLGPVLQIAEGITCELPVEVNRVLDERTDPGWPTTWFAPRLTGSGAFRDVYGVMAGWGANHGAFSYGHIGAELITLASMLRIPVCMHNVPAEKICRPAAWAAFGMEPECADFRACAAYGPLYR